MNEISNSGAHKYSRTEEGSLSSQIPHSSERKFRTETLRPMNTNDTHLL